jgi:hypothetical protein
VNKDSFGTFFELLILLLWIFGGRFFRAMQERNNRRVEAAGQDPLPEAVEPGEEALPPVVEDVPNEPVAPSLPTRVDTVDELAVLEDALEEEPSYNPEDYAAIRQLLQEYDQSPYVEAEGDQGGELPPLSEKKNERSLSEAPANDRAREAIVVGEILGSPRAHSPFFRERRAFGLQRKRAH